jgi:hypothetical protein
MSICLIIIDKTKKNENIESFLKVGKNLFFNRVGHNGGAQ